MLPVLAVWLIFFFLAKEAPAERKRNRWSDYAAVLGIADTGWFCFLYSLTFGGFVGLASYLSIFFHDQYRLTPVQAGDFTTVVVLFGSFLRPVGGMLADRLGGYRMLLRLLAGVAVCLCVVSTLPNPLIALAALAVCMAMLGMGNGAVFQLAPQRFPDRIGIMTGIIGAAGGFGGFLLPSILGTLKDRTGAYSAGFGILAACAFVGFGVLLYLKGIWRTTWPAKAARRAGLQTADSEEAVVAYAAPI
jgi:NNP family nitrate/nitrite transporter-like MFS transporter